MTIRRMWLIILIAVAVAAVVINAVILSVLTDRHFTDYLSENYDLHVAQMTEYAKSVLLQNDISLTQATMEMETHLDDPITHIKLYDAEGNELVHVSVEEHMMMSSRMMGRFSTRYNEADSETDSIELYDGDVFIGQLNITRYSSIEESAATVMFKSSLFYNSLYSVAAVLVIAVLVGIIVSKKISKALSGTAQMAQNIEHGTQSEISETNIREINTIQQSLETLQSKLRLKNKSRKVLIDELVHQTRTPLTVLKMHLEGFEDGILQMSPEEVKICETQVENIMAIISNMSNIIDAGEDIEKVNPSSFELSSLIRQIANGLKAQFDKKGIKLELSLEEKEDILTDRHKLSQALYNVLTNAYKYTNPGGTVSVSYMLKNDNISISIQDNGAGIDGKDIDKIFNAYYRSGWQQTEQGDGLGLYIAKENLIKINGSISVESKKDNGSKFVITLPNRYEEKGGQ